MAFTRRHYGGLLILLFVLVFFLAYDKAPTIVVEAQTVHKVGLEFDPPVIPEDRIGAHEYLEITNSCNAYFEGHCIPAYTGPGIKYEKITDLRNGMVLKVKNKIEKDGQVWYQVYFDEWLRYPDRAKNNWYIPSVAGHIVKDDGLLTKTQASSTKKIIISLTNHMLYAYDGDKEFLVTKVSTGVDTTPTPLGTFSVYKKTPSRYMQGPIEGITDEPFDLPGVPWNLYFTKDGAVIHGSYWHERYGTEQSNGCINLPPELSKLLYDWVDVGTKVTITR